MKLEDELKEAVLDMSLPLLGEWVEIDLEELVFMFLLSLPLLGEWVEIYHNSRSLTSDCVSPFAGRVG